MSSESVLLRRAGHGGQFQKSAESETQSGTAGSVQGGGDELAGTALKRLAGTALKRLAGTALKRLAGTALKRLAGTALKRLAGTALKSGFDHSSRGGVRPVPRTWLPMAGR
jgi:hypothetical protein